MSKKILCIGDSFTFGEELPHPNTQSWPSLLASANNWNVNNMGKSGASNDRSVRILFDEIDNNYDLIILSWTTYLRFEVFNVKSNTPVSLAPKTFMEHGAYWAKSFYGDWCNNLFLYKRMLTQIIQTQSYLKLINQPYIFSMAFNVYPDSSFSEFKSLLNKIDTSLFFQWPNTLNSIVEGLPRGINGHPLNQGHQKIATEMNNFIHNVLPSFKTE